MKLRWILAFWFLCIASSSSQSETLMLHNFGFDAGRESPDIEVLNYQYGDSHQIGTRADKIMLDAGMVFPSGGVTGVMPKGEFLYVKWRIKDSGQVYEENVDLKSRLPKDITDYAVHFVIKGRQIYVFLIPPPGVFPSDAIKRAGRDERVSAYLKAHQIYPDIEK